MTSQSEKDKTAEWQRNKGRNHEGRDRYHRRVLDQTGTYAYILNELRLYIALEIDLLSSQKRNNPDHL